MKYHISLKITSVNEKGTIHTNYITCLNHIEAARIVITFKPKRGYEIREWLLERTHSLI